MRPAALLLAGTILAPVSVQPQVARGDLDTAAVAVDSGDVASVARAAQARFERRRIRLLPLSYDPFGGSCDEVVGRICTTYGEGEWYPQPESPELVALRRELLAELDSLQSLVPGDPWILGQRVWYRGEGGDWEGARGVARACGAVGGRPSWELGEGSSHPGTPPPASPSRWWCLALEGFALHGVGEHEASLAAFAEALDLMDPERAERWRVPRWPVDRDVRDLLDEALAAPRLAGAAGATLLERLWALADPLWLVEGNDRLTAHYARWTFTEIRQGARNPFRLSWGDDMTELTVRHGWQVGWERTPARDYSSVDHVVGHNHPLGRDYMPSREDLDDPAGIAAGEIEPHVRRPRSLYAPEYAPVLLPMDGQIAVFPRGDRMAVVATHFLPADTTFHAEHRHPLPWLDPGDQADMPDRTGLFALEVPSADPASTDARRRGVRSLHRTDGASLLEVPTGHYVISAESWSPSRRRAGRMRLGVRARAAPPDIAVLSDVLLLRPASLEPESLEAALDLALPRPAVRPGQTFAIGWEVAGLGFRPETLVFDVSVAPVGRGVLGRIGDFLGLSSPPPRLTLSWQEPGPTEPGYAFRYLALDLPELEEGEYEIRLTLRTAGRSEAVTTRRFEVLRRDRGTPGPGG